MIVPGDTGTKIKGTTPLNYRSESLSAFRFSAKQGQKRLSAIACWHSQFSLEGRPQP
jgi:hypothetical protein